MMLCLALRSSPERVYERALRQFSVQEITEGFAAARGLALPSQLRRMLRARAATSTPSSSAEVMAAAPGILGYASREALGQALEHRSGGRLHLDPQGR